MKRVNGCFFWVAVAYLLFHWSICGVYAVSISNIEIFQVDWADSNGTVQVPNSAWGRMDMDVVADSSEIYYLNVLASSGLGSAWIIQNYPVFPDDIGRASLRQIVEFDITEMGVSVGESMGTIDVTYSLTSWIESSVPGGNAVSITSQSIEYNMVNKDETWNFAEIGEPVGHKASVPVEKKNVIQHKDVHGVQEGKKRCLAGSFARSISWLDKKYKLNTGKDSQKIYQDLRALHIGSGAGDAKVTSYEDDIAAKSKYLKKKSGNSGITKILDPENTVGSVTGVKQDSTTDILKWILYELPTEDMELHYGPHIITITGYYKQGTSHYIKFRDDETQDNDSAGDTGEKEALLYKSGSHYYFREKGSTNSFMVKALFSESVPEPATLLLFGSAIMAVAIGRIIRFFM